MNSFLIDHLNILKKKFSNPELELRILLNKSSFYEKEIILSNFHKADVDLQKFKLSFYRRMANEPISKIFNIKSFWKYDFYVTEDVLDPRPETELIIEKILNYFPDKNETLNILDMCTGSGCIAISIAKEYKNSKINATDISSSAIKVARINAKNLNCLNQIDFDTCDLIKKKNTFDIVVCNPPYLSELDYKEVSLEIKKYEPKIALVSDRKGYGFYYKISKILPNILTKKSFAFIEIGSSQATKIINIFKLNQIKSLEKVKDLQNLDRLLILNKP